MPSIDLNQSYKTQCKYCGLVKKSLVPGNFVCKDCEKFCEQQLSGEELKSRNKEVLDMISTARHFSINKPWTLENGFIAHMFSQVCDGVRDITHSQYLSVYRILKRKS